MSCPVMSSCHPTSPHLTSYSRHVTSRHVMVLHSRIIESWYTMCRVVRTIPEQPFSISCTSPTRHSGREVHTLKPPTGEYANKLSPSFRNAGRRQFQAGIAALQAVCWASKSRLIRASNLQAAQHPSGAAPHRRTTRLARCPQQDLVRVAQIGFRMYHSASASPQQPWSRHGSSCQRSNRLRCIVSAIALGVLI